MAYDITVELHKLATTRLFSSAGWDPVGILLTGDPYLFDFGEELWGDYAEYVKGSFEALVAAYEYVGTTCDIDMNPVQVDTSVP